VARPDRLWRHPGAAIARGRRRRAPVCDRPGPAPADRGPDRGRPRLRRHLPRRRRGRGPDHRRHQQGRPGGARDRRSDRTGRLYDPGAHRPAPSLG
ncbi:hypothetical protein LTR94_036214, partial [Friedmanniomyces endolithicus]